MEYIPFLAFANYVVFTYMYQRLVYQWPVVWRQNIINTYILETIYDPLLEISAPTTRFCLLDDLRKTQHLVSPGLLITDPRVGPHAQVKSTLLRATLYHFTVRRQYHAFLVCDDVAHRCSHGRGRIEISHDPEKCRPHSVVVISPPVNAV